MYDDAKPNLHTFIELKKDHPKTRFYAWHVSPKGDAAEYMREGIVAEKKKRKKPRWAAYGPGPYGGYGYATGYSGDGGGGGVGENFADGKKPGRKGLAKRSGVNTKASVSSLRKTAKNSSGEKQRMAHWLANMKAGRAKKNK
jgi:hypothetical protein